LRFTRYLGTCKRTEFASKINKVKWISKRELYKQDFPYHLLERIEWFYSRLSFEKEVENKLITPLWYKVDLLSHAESQLLIKAYTEIVNSTIERYESWQKQCLEKNNIWLCASLQSSELEYWNKFEYHIKLFKDTWDDIVTNNKINDLSWPNLDFEKLLIIYEERLKKLYSEISLNCPKLYLNNRAENFPDYAGQFLHIILNKIVEVVSKGDEEQFYALYKPFFYSSLLKFDELWSSMKHKDWRINYEIQLSLTPFIDLLLITGYSLLMSYYHDKTNISTIINEEWNKYFQENSEKRLEIIMTTIDLHDNNMSVHNRSFERANWKLKITSYLKSIKQEANIDRYDPFNAIVQHENPIVRIFAQESLRDMYDGIDIFIENIIRESENYDQIEISEKRRGFHDTIIREEKKWDDFKGIKS